MSLAQGARFIINSCQPSWRFLWHNNFCSCWLQCFYTTLWNTATRYLVRVGNTHSNCSWVQVAVVVAPHFTLSPPRLLHNYRDQFVFVRSPPRIPFLFPEYQFTVCIAPHWYGITPCFVSMDVPCLSSPIRWSAAYRKRPVSVHEVVFSASPERGS